ncbi:MAG: T9SS type A sorting domain-containing protein [Chitinophagaceae bacterium]|jgi:hypothetical protein|nr:T9SS type A sorting domain-containing protein [Chitinophagaceae bacterium]
MNKIRLSIDEPCHEKWKNMTTTQQGRFCASCQKEVVDFTGMSDTAMFEFFKDRQAGSVCGRFMNNQLQRDIEATRKRTPWLPFVFKVVLPALLLGNRAMAQGAPLKVVPDTTQKPVYDLEKIGRIAVSPEMRTVRITVRNEEGQVIAGARVHSTSDLTELITDENGRLEIKVPRYVGNITFFVDVVGYGKLERSVKLPSHKRKARVSLVVKDEYKEIIMGMVAYPSKQQVKKEAVCETDMPLRMYPNPVAAGQKIWLKTDSLEKDNYTLQLLDQAGTVQLQQAMQIDGKNKTVEINIPRLTAGNYLLTATAAATGRRRSGQIVLH